MKMYNLYGLKDSNLETARHLIETMLQVTFTARDSSFRGGDYYLYRNIDKGEEMILQVNYSPLDKEYLYEEFSDYNVLFIFEGIDQDDSRIYVMGQSPEFHLLISKSR